MISYLVRRLFHAALTFLGITFVVFVLIHAVPGDPVRFFASEAHARNVPPAVLTAMRHEFGLDRPLLVQYGDWLGKVVRLDFGASFADQRPVTEKILERLPWTIELNLVAFLIAALLGVPAGIAAGAHPGGWFDRATSSVSFLLYSVPGFWAALMLIELFAVKLQVLPLYGMSSDAAASLPLLARLADHASHLVLPATALALAQFAIFARFTRASIFDVARREFVVAARARGSSESRLLWHHALRNAAIPLVTLLGLVLPYLLSGSVIIERIFQWNGIGFMYFEAILERDYPVIMGLTVITAIATLLASVATDLLYALVDPRVRIGEGVR